MIYPVILSGGSGTRLWPISRQHYPKQFLALAGEETLLQQTAQRAREGEIFAPPLMVCNEAHRFVVAEQLRQIGCQPLAMLLEPEGRQTAAAIAAAAWYLLERDPDARMLVMPTDHYVASPKAWLKAVKHAQKAATRHWAVLFGVAPTQAETGYGYLLPAKQDAREMTVARFEEKPARARAGRLIAQGALWNSGMFLLQAKAYLQRLKQEQPEIYRGSRRAVSAARADLDFLRLESRAFQACPAISIDDGVLSRSTDLMAVRLDCGWSDVGSWGTWYALAAKDASGNHQSGDVVMHGVKNCMAISEGPLTVVLGGNDLLVVTTHDAVLVADRNQLEDLKPMVSALEKQGRREAAFGKKTYRPWGFFQTLYATKGAQVKELHIKPGAQISLQKHTKRAEHWVVMQGRAQVTRGAEQHVVRRHESIFIPASVKHRIRNTTKAPLIIIEVQTGAQIDENDIIRYADDFGRVPSRKTSRRA